MVAQGRRLRLAGYEVYRFGGWELTPYGERILTDFFRRTPQTAPGPRLADRRSLTFGAPRTMDT